jgi:hypothetical protein
VNDKYNGMFERKDYEFGGTRDDFDRKIGAVIHNISRAKDVLCLQFGYRDALEISTGLAQHSTGEYYHFTACYDDVKALRGAVLLGVTAQGVKVCGPDSDRMCHSEQHLVFHTSLGDFTHLACCTWYEETVADTSFKWMCRDKY